MQGRFVPLKNYCSSAKGVSAPSRCPRQAPPQEQQQGKLPGRAGGYKERASARPEQNRHGGKPMPPPPTCPRKALLRHVWEAAGGRAHGGDVKGAADPKQRSQHAVLLQRAPVLHARQAHAACVHTLCVCVCGVWSMGAVCGWAQSQGCASGGDAGRNKVQHVLPPAEATSSLQWHKNNKKRSVQRRCRRPRPQAGTCCGGSQEGRRVRASASGFEAARRERRDTMPAGAGGGERAPGGRDTHASAQQPDRWQRHTGDWEEGRLRRRGCGQVRQAGRQARAGRQAGRRLHLRSHPAATRCRRDASAPQLQPAAGGPDDRRRGGT